MHIILTEMLLHLVGMIERVCVKLLKLMGSETRYAFYDRYNKMKDSCNLRQWEKVIGELDSLVVNKVVNPQVRSLKVALTLSPALCQIRPINMCFILLASDVRNEYEKGTIVFLKG